VQESLLRNLSANLHQLTQPLSILQASLELSLLKPNTAAQFREVAEEALRQLGRAAETLHFTSQLTRYYQPPSDEGEVLLSHVLEDVLADLGRTLTSSQIKLSLVRSGHEREILFSPTRLRQLFFYVFQAVQHLSQPGDIVRVAVRASATHAALRISHVPGCRMQPAAQARSSHDPSTHALTLAEAIMASAGGKLTVTSTPLLIVASFPARRLTQPHPAVKSQFDRPTLPTLEAGSH
jgi:hypothetical protein